MAILYRFILLALLHSAQCYLGCFSVAVCESPQYLNYGKVDTIKCFFDDKFLSVLWFNTSDYKQREPTIHLQDFSKSGAGYESGEFDIFHNGSLIVNNVTLRHDTTFTVVYVHTRNDDIIIFNIAVVVIVKPKEAFPRINHCGDSNMCFAEVGSYSVQCSVGNARPIINLQWIARTADGDINVTQELSVTSGVTGYTSQVTTRGAFLHLPLLVLLVCKAANPYKVLENNKSLILAQTKNVSLLDTVKKLCFVEQYSPMSLHCTSNDIGFLVWKKQLKDETNNQMDHINLLYSIYFGQKWTETFVNDMSLGRNTSLVVPFADVEHEGLYYCIYGDGFQDGLSVHEVIIKVNPVPAYPVVEGCHNHQHCVLVADYEGNLTCKVQRIRPRVQLQWTTLPASDATAIVFTNYHLTVKEIDETFDVILTTTYHVLHESIDRMTIECRVASYNQKIFQLATKVDLLFYKDELDLRTSMQPISKTYTSIFSIMLAFLLFMLVSLLRVIYRKKFRKRKRTKSRTVNGHPEEDSEMLQSTDFHSQNSLETSIKALFLRQLKERYTDLYNAVQPIPYVKDRLYCVDKVFVEGGIEFTDAITVLEKTDEWKRLKSYEEILSDPRVKSKRRMIEGDPGYGKSTITLQFAHDWCTSRHNSPLNNVDILIALRLRQLGEIHSIYRAIKQFLLPQDTTVTESDIENILRNCSTVLVILDGFDEYPDRDNKPDTDVINIITRQMFQDFDVITTTRSSVLPKKCPPLTKRIRLTGFDENSRRYYIRKAVVGEDEERVREIEQYLEQNPILSDLCQVPLLFVLFAHVTNESENFRNLNSVTSLFRYMITCFHCHMKIKMEDKNVNRCEMFETAHHNFDRVAFEALSGKAQKIVWEKEELCKRVGVDFYEQYLRIGILVEEEVIHINDTTTLITEHIQNKEEVGFYHKIFCEWYAAHYLAYYLHQNPNVDLRVFLQHLDPFDVQYLYRFSCGLNSDSAEKVISYLKSLEGGDKFAILCILEQTGKFGHIEESIRKLCDEGIIISGHDSLLLQRTSVQLLEIAAKNNILIRGVSLHNCLESVNLSTSAIKTTTGLFVTARIAIKELAIHLYNRKLTENEIVDLVKFSSMCPSLKILKLGGSPPPHFLPVAPHFTTLNSRNVQVRWQLFRRRPWYVLNLLTGQWMGRRDGKQPTTDEFQQMETEFENVLRRKSDDGYRKSVNRMRGELRTKTEMRRQGNRT